MENLVTLVHLSIMVPIPHCPFCFCTITRTQKYIHAHAHTQIEREKEKESAGDTYHANVRNIGIFTVQDKPLLRLYSEKIKVKANFTES